MTATACTGTADGAVCRPAWPGTRALLPALLQWAGARRWFPLKSGPVPRPEQVRVVVDTELADGVHDLLLALPAPAAAGSDGERQAADGAQVAGGVVLLHVPLVVDEPAALPRLTGPKEADGAAGFVLEAASGPGAGQADGVAGAEADGVAGAATGCESGPARVVALVDGPHHPAFWAAWARSAIAAGTLLDERAARAVARRAQVGRLRVTTGEQSNTSVVLPAPAAGVGSEPAKTAGAAQGAGAVRAGDPDDAATGDLIVKVFRVLAPGRNPDVEVSVALARDGWDRVRHPVAWSTMAFTDPTTGEQAVADSAVGTTFIPAATDGFELFCQLAGAGQDAWGRSLSLARDLGKTTGQMHLHLAAALGQSEPVAPAVLAASLGERAAWALAEVPELGQRLPGLESAVQATLSELAGLDRLEPATRVHGDYHLGQTLHEDGGAQRWFVLDFEGEPLRPLAERSRPDQSARDVAGMLRSFDYAAAVGQAGDPAWLTQVREAFVAGYRAVRPLPAAQGGPHGAPDPAAAHRAQVLLDALELDKALYEAVYEARNRPRWLWIPLNGIARILGQELPEDAGRGGSAPSSGPVA